MRKSCRRISTKLLIQKQRGKWSDGVTVEKLFSYIKEHKEEILNKIRTRKYKSQPIRRIYIPKGNGELRKLGIPSVIERILQQE